MSERRALTPPLDLTVPLPGSTTARDVLSRAVARLLRELRPLVRTHAFLLHPSDAQALDRLAAAAVKDRLGPLASVLRRPNVGALVRTLRRPKTEADAVVLRELAALLTFELAVTGELPVGVRLVELPPRILSFAAGVALHLPAEVELAEWRPGSMKIRREGRTYEIDLDALRAGHPSGEGTRGMRVSRPFTVVDGASVLAALDNNPHAMDEAHPEKSGNAVDLGGVPVATWVKALEDAFGLIARYLPDLRHEMALYIAQVVPVGAFADRHLSASYREAIGTVYLSLHPSPMTMVEALIHEFQHGKLNALFELDEVLENAFYPLYPSPVRPDLRPLHGVLLAVHAFLPVARLYEKMIEDHHPLALHPSFHARLAEIIAINRAGAEVVLTHGKPTPLGVGVLDEIGRLSAAYRCGT